MPKSKRTKALEIPPRVKKKVLERDGWCIWCGRQGLPNAHYIARSQGGLGIEQNILTLCPDCHRRYDQTVHRKEMREYFRNYLKEQYPNWDESTLIYNRWV